MLKCKLENVVPTRETAARIIKNMARMHDRVYRPGVAGTKEAESVGWPGDWEGRAVLALSLEAKALKIEPAYLDQLVEWIIKNCNAHGYRGEILDFEAINEQSLAGHSWLLRGLIEYYTWKPNRSVLQTINQIVENLYLPLKGKFANYPRKPEERIHEGQAAGALTGLMSSGWKVSSDTGCAFISLDGLSHMYEFTGDIRILELLEEMIAVFMTIDFVGISMQTHATLTACRGIMRVYAKHSKPEYLQFCQKIFDIYKKEGMTENYANYNWFSKPSWTEPCGIIDAFMMATFLWEETKDTMYLRDAHDMWYNGVCRGQRPNGGFGCDHCVEDGTVQVHENFYEAFWCCSMRGGEGTTFAATCSLVGESDTLRFLYYFDGKYEVPWVQGLVLDMQSDYPRDGKISIKIKESPDVRNMIDFYFYIPEWAKNMKCIVDGRAIDFQTDNSFIKAKIAPKKGMEIQVEFDVPLFVMPVIGNQHKGSNYVTIRHGSLILGAETESTCVDIAALKYEGNGKYSDGACIYKPLDDAYLMETEEVKDTSYRILFYNKK